MRSIFIHLEESSIGREVLPGIAAKQDLLQVCRGEVKALDGRYGDRRRELERKPIRARADRGKGNGVQLVLQSELQRSPIAGGEQLSLTASATPPNGSNSVNDMTRRKLIAAGYPGIANLTAAQSPAFRKQLRAGSGVNRPVHAAATEQRGVGGVHNRIDIECRDVRPDRCEGRQSVTPRWSRSSEVGIEVLEKQRLAHE